MDAEFVLNLASSSWLKWFCCPHCGSDYTISKNGRCTACDEHLVIVRSQEAGSDILNDFLIPWQTGSSFYYHLQWNQLVRPIIEVNNS
jgi:hypothetical protein